MRVIVEQDKDGVSRRAAQFVAKLVRKRPNCVLGLATGSTPLGMYAELIRMHREEGLDFSRVVTFNLDEYVYHALKAGASGFLLKDASREQRTSAVRAVAAGEALPAPAITRRLIEDFCRGPAPGTAAATAAGRLSERELGVVRLVAQGLSNAEIAARLYLSEATVKSHIARILAKLDLRDRVQVAVYAYEHGIIRPGRGTQPPGRGARP